MSEFGSFSGEDRIHPDKYSTSTLKELEYELAFYRMRESIGVARTQEEKDAYERLKMELFLRDMKDKAKFSYRRVDGGYTEITPLVYHVYDSNKDKVLIEKQVPENIAFLINRLPLKNVIKTNILKQLNIILEKYIGKDNSPTVVSSIIDDVQVFLRDVEKINRLLILNSFDVTVSSSEALSIIMIPKINCMCEDKVQGDNSPVTSRLDF